MLPDMAREPQGVSDGAETEAPLTKAMIEGVYANVPSRIPLNHTDAVEAGSGGGVTHNQYTAKAGSYDAAGEITRLLSGIAEELVYQEQEQALSLALQEESDRIDYGDAHQGVDIIINRMVDVPEALVWQYQQVAPAGAWPDRQTDGQAGHPGAATRYRRSQAELYGQTVHPQSPGKR